MQRCLCACLLCVIGHDRFIADCIGTGGPALAPFSLVQLNHAHDPGVPSRARQRKFSVLIFFRGHWTCNQSFWCMLRVKFAEK
jgi:hypothetical protein